MDGKLYNIERKYQISQARKARIDFRIGENFVPETAEFRIDEMDDLQLKL